MLEGLVDIYLPDLKYLDSELAGRYSKAPDYPKYATEAIAEMVRQITIPNITKTENLSEIENTFVITTNKGNNIETQYEMFDGFKIKIPS